jgi:hypothetical protein
MAPYAATLIAEAGFGFGALATSVSWTTLGSVLDYSSTRGRSSEFDYFPTASLGVRLADYDRRYDPLNSAGAYAGSLVPNVPFRVTATHDGTVYPRAYGYVDEWSAQPRRNVGFVDVRASDGFKILAQAMLPQSVYETVVPADSPHFYWRLGESGPVAVDSSGNGHSGFYAARGVEQNARVVRPFGEGSFKGAADSYRPVVAESTAAMVTAVPMTVELWLVSDPIQRPASSVVAYYVFNQGSATASERAGMSYVLSSDGTADQIVVGHDGGTGNTSRKYGLGKRLDDGQVHHVVAVIESAVTTLYIDGQVVAMTASDASFGADSQPVGFALGGFVAGQTFSSWPGFISDLGVYDVALTAAQVAEHYEAGTAPWDGDFTGARIGRILDLVGWPSALRDLDSGEVLLGPADLDGMNALAYLRLVAQSEGGRLFMSADGKVTFHDAARIRADTAASVTFSDDGSDNPYIYGSLKYTDSDRWVRNHAVIQRKYGLPQTVADATSIEAYGTQTLNLSGLLMRSDAQARGRAEGAVYRYKDPQTRVDSWTVNPQQKVATWAATLALELGEHVNLEVTPAGVGSQAVIEMDLEQIVERATSGRYEFTFIGSPRDPNIGNYFTWGSGDPTLGWGTAVWA